MNPPLHTLPVRLVPHAKSRKSIFALCAATTAFSIAWLFIVTVKWRALAAGNPRDLDPWDHVFAPLIGAAMAVFGIGGFIAAYLRTLPNSPFFHIELSSDGLTIRRIIARTFPWRELPLFETLREEISYKRGTEISHCTVGMQPAQSPRGESPGATHLREVLRIDGDQYGSKKAEQNVAELADWLNTLRQRAMDGQLDMGAPIEVPETFRRNAIVVSR